MKKVVAVLSGLAALGVSAAFAASPDLAARAAACCDFISACCAGGACC